MKVLILATDIFSRGGIARYTSTLASSLAEPARSGKCGCLMFLRLGIFRRTSQ